LQILSNKENKFLLASLFVIVTIFIIANIVNQEQYQINGEIYLTNILFIVIPIIVIALGIILSVIYKGTGNHGKAWILFTIFITVWFVGDNTYEYDVKYNIEDISTLTSDIFYIVGYPIFFAFTLFYLKPRKNMISKNIVLASVLTSIAVTIPTLYITFEGKGETDNLTMFLYAIYPILDGLIFAPTMIAVILFFRGQVNFLWTMILFATLSMILADTLYLVFAVEKSYYPGHPIDILYLFSYILYAFGVYSHIKLYRIPSKTIMKR
jgi:hypothetical protein